MTLDELRRSEKAMLVPTDIAELLGVKPYSINVQAKADVRQLGFPAALIGTRVLMPREGFLHWFDGWTER